MPIIIAQHDASVAMKVAQELRPHFAHVAVVTSIMELHRTLLSHKARVAILDMELLAIEEVQKLARTFTHLRIVCTHRSPDERKWIAALNAGAIELCHPTDTHSIVRASRKLAARTVPACA